VVLLDEAATWTGVGALALSALLLALGIVLFTRWRRAAAGEIADIRAAGERTESLLIELRRALGDAQAEGRRLSALGEVGTTLDLDAALERALGAVTQLAEADAAMIVLSQEDEEPITATYGLTGEESVRDLLGVPPEAGRARAVKLGYVFTPEEEANDAFRLSGGRGDPRRLLAAGRAHGRRRRACALRGARGGVRARPRERALVLGSPQAG
jgi:hypothetical protein